MFDMLIESKRKRDGKRFLGVGAVSVVVHSVIIGGAVVVTWSIGQGDTKVHADTSFVYLSQPKPAEETPAQLDIPLKGFQNVVAPTEIPTNIPPINLQEHFDPKDYSGSGVEGGLADGRVLDGVYLESLVEEKPEMLSHPPLQYPELLRQAGVQGQVTIEAVVDTSGRVIPSTVKILQSANPGFNEPARQLVIKALLRPGRVHGRAVPVLLHIPVVFTLRGS